MTVVELAIEGACKGLVNELGPDQLYEAYGVVPPDGVELSDMVVPEQYLELVLLAVIDGEGFTVTVMLAVTMQ